MCRGYLKVAAAFTAWGVLPVYWKQLAGTRPELILFHRVLWSLVFLGMFAALRRARHVRPNRHLCQRDLFITAGAAMLLAANWYAYLWAMISGQLVASGLGYVICPIITVFFAALLYGERLAGYEKTALALMAAGVALRAVMLGSCPWLALLLAVSFAGYSVLKKKCSLDPVSGLLLECCLLILPTFLVAALLRGNASFAIWTGSTSINALLIGSGLITAVPLLWLAAGMKEVKLKFVGITQYLAPTLTLLLAVIVYDEPVTAADWVSFPLIWAGALFFVLKKSSAPSGQNQMATRPADEFARRRLLAANSSPPFPQACRLRGK